MKIHDSIKRNQYFQNTDDLFKYYFDQFGIHPDLLKTPKINWTLLQNGLPEITFQSELEGKSDQVRKVEYKISINFLEDLKYQRKSNSASKELISRACGWSFGSRTVLDLTAGFGVDALFLARLGFKVVSVERNPVLFVLLNEALRHARTAQDQSNEKSEFTEKTESTEKNESNGDLNISSSKVKINLFLNNINFYYQDGKSYLSSVSSEVQNFDTIYYDPMYPHTDKSSLPSKEMQFLRSTVGQDEADDEIVKVSLEKCKKLVVVKRPVAAPYVFKKPNRVYESKLVRFDVYESSQNKL